ncbi:metal ABC transporter substrate-binding protein [Actinacidiphila paucisporea]|uniref:Zinc transport system substrate-binding protein n=1 Tax=Actinacidiphila paucisporea TaxID=310782 RepID=A0A1M6XAN3_9ACTN|nr:metal ABC transporter substrate-binding protein [Actinacidiphila paucisporea]SHL03021.1 zinc transport system substrate-binding protein [Actinacidiphila paucisporea]
MNISRRVIPVATLAVAALALPALAACSGPAGAAGDGKGGGKLRVTASFYPLEFLADSIGGDHVQVTDLTKSGVEPHDLELAPRQIAALGRSDVVISLHGLQPAVDDAIKQSGVKNLVDAAALTGMEDHGTEVDGRHHTTGDNGSGAQSAEDAGSDPHIWLDPVKYAEVARGVGKALAEADPAHSAAYAKNTDTLVGRLGVLDTAFRDGLKNRTTDTFITTHAAFGYLAERYGLVEEAINGLDPESEPSATRMKALLDLAGREHVTTVFFETLVSDKTAKTVAGDLHLRTDVLDPIEGITPKSRGTDYFAVQRSNLAALQTALGVRR